MVAVRAITRAAGVLLLAFTPGACSLAFPVHAGSVYRAADAGSVYRAAVLADAPAVYLRFGEKAGSVAADEMNRFPGTYPGSVRYGVPGAITNDSDTAIEFDGTGGVKMPPGLDFADNAPFTIEVWAKQTQYAGDGLTIDHEEFYPVRDGWVLRFGDGTVGVERFRDDVTRASLRHSPEALPIDGNYHHVVATFDRERLRLYVDGEVVKGDEPQPTDLKLKHLNNEWTIGAQNCCTGVAFIGALDEVAIYEHPLTFERIELHHQIGVSGAR